MKLLCRIALMNRRVYRLLLVTIFSLICLTIASQLEIFTLRVITDKGADFFELFASERNEKISQQRVASVSKDEVLTNWEKIDKDKKGHITKSDANSYIKNNKSHDLVTYFLRWLEERIPLTSNLKNLALMIIFVGIFKAISQFSSQYTQQLVAIRVSRDLRQSYFEHLQSLSMAFYHRYHIGNLSSRVMGDAVAISDGINSFFIICSEY